MAFSRQSEASAENAVKWAKDVGLSSDAIEVCRKSQDLVNKLKDDVAVADRIGVTGTPSLFINGVRYDGDRSTAGLSQALDSALIEVQ
jgi:protein-disulfide isomerase